MSDPVSSMDVEDVLSSIRRLVSEEAKAAEPSRESQPSRESPVLDRQTDIHEEAENAASAAVSHIEHQSFGEPSDAMAGEPPSNEISPSQPEANASEAQVSFRHKSANARGGVDKKLVLTAALRVAEAENSGLRPPREEELPAPKEARQRRPGRPHLRSVSPDQAALGGAEDARSDGAAPGSKLDFAPEDTLFERAKRAMESVKSTPVETPAYVFNAETMPEPPEAGQPANLKAPLENVSPAEPKFEDLPQDPEIELPPDGEATPNLEEHAVDEGSATSPFRSGGGALDPAKDVADGEIEDEVSTINFVEEEESVIDEETLRDMVSEMVREELQGELGDRITRNVRKLVRREIQRALASREFE